MHIAMIGTRGVPARYGGFETCVEEVGTRLADRGHQVTVYCRRARATTTLSSSSGCTGSCCLRCVGAHSRPCRTPRRP